VSTEHGRESRSSPRKADGASPVLVTARPAQRRKLSQEVASQLLELIASSASAEVTLPAERQLCEQLSVSRNVLREALAALGQLGVYDTRGKARVAHVSRARAQLVARLPTSDGEDNDPMLDQIEVRRMLEPEVASVAAMRASEGAVGEIERWNALMEDAIKRGDSVIEYDSAFHVAIARATGNSTLVELVRSLNDALRASRELSFKPEQAAAQALVDHQAIIAALRANDAELAHTVMQSHLVRVERFIRASLETPN
jgi:GntR family transcriptional repressor for pyruvate dehydrogenase complex